SKISAGGWLTTGAGGRGRMIDPVVSADGCAIMLSMPTLDEQPASAANASEIVPTIRKRIIPAPKLRYEKRQQKLTLSLPERAILPHTDCSIRIAGKAESKVYETLKRGETVFCLWL